MSLFPVDGSLSSPNPGENSMDDLFPQIRAGNQTAAAHLRKSLTLGVRWYLRRNRVGNLEENLALILDAAMQAVHNGYVEKFSVLASFLRSAAVAWMEQTKTSNLQAAAPEPAGRDVERMKTALSAFDVRERESLLRYYQGQSPDRICGEMDFSHAELSALKSRLQAQYAKLNRQPAASALGKVGQWIHPRVA